MKFEDKTDALVGACNHGYTYDHNYVACLNFYSQMPKERLMFNDSKYLLIRI